MIERRFIFAALVLDKENSKALARRAMLHEHLENYEDALADFQALMEQKPTAIAKAAVERLPKLIEQKNEKMKAEMMGKF